MYLEMDEEMQEEEFREGQAHGHGDGGGWER